MTIDGTTRADPANPLAHLSDETIAELANTAHYFRLDLPEDVELTSGLDASYVYDHPVTTLPAKDNSHLGIFYPIMGHMCHIPVIEVDIETGKISILNYAAVHDCGTMVNPMIVDGQVHGGLAQGIGQALLEAARYNEDGQLESASYMDYAMPRADDLPFYIVDHSQGTPCTHNPLGAKGCGEAGAIGSPPTVVNAVIDALQSGGKNVTHIDMPLTPHRVWSAMNNA